MQYPIFHSLYHMANIHSQYLQYISLLYLQYIFNSPYPIVYISQYIFHSLQPIYHNIYPIDYIYIIAYITQPISQSIYIIAYIPQPIYNKPDPMAHNIMIQRPLLLAHNPQTINTQWRKIKWRLTFVLRPPDSSMKSPWFSKRWRLQTQIEGRELVAGRGGSGRGAGERWGGRDIE